MIKATKLTASLLAFIIFSSTGLAHHNPEHTALGEMKMQYNCEYDSANSEPNITEEDTFFPSKATLNVYSQPTVLGGESATIEITGHEIDQLNEFVGSHFNDYNIHFENHNLLTCGDIEQAMFTNCTAVNADRLSVVAHHIATAPNGAYVEEDTLVFDAGAGTAEYNSEHTNYSGGTPVTTTRTLRFHSCQ